MNLILAIVMGGSIGALARHYAVASAMRLWGESFPYGTLIVNVVGSFVIGVLMETMAQKWQVSLEMRAFLVTGVLGGFTTFSAFSFDVLKLVEAGQVVHACIYVLLSVILSLAAVFAAVYFTRGVLA